MAQSTIDVEITGEALARAEVASGSLEEETFAAELLLDDLLGHAGIVRGVYLGVPAGGGGVAGVVEKRRDGLLVEGVDADDADGAIDNAAGVAADDDAAVWQRLAAVHINVAFALCGSDAGGLEILHGLPDGSGDLMRKAAEVFKYHVATLRDDGDAEGVGAGVGVGAGEADVGEGEAGERSDGVEDALGPFGIEADGIDVDDGDGLGVIAKDEGGGVEGKIGAEAALVGLRAPTSLRCAGGRGDIGAAGTGQELRHASLYEGRY